MTGGSVVARDELILVLRDTGDIEGRTLQQNRELLHQLDLNTTIVPGVDRPARVFYRRVHGARMVVDAGAQRLLDMRRCVVVPQEAC